MRILKCDKCGKIAESLIRAADVSILKGQWPSVNLSTFALFDLEMCNECWGNATKPINEAYVKYGEMADKIKKRMDRLKR